MTRDAEGHLVSEMLDPQNACSSLPATSRNSLVRSNVEHDPGMADQWRNPAPQYSVDMLYIDCLSRPRLKQYLKAAVAYGAVYQQAQRPTRRMAFPINRHVAAPIVRSVSGSRCLTCGPIARFTIALAENSHKSWVRLPKVIH